MCFPCSGLRYSKLAAKWHGQKKLVLIGLGSIAFLKVASLYHHRSLEHWACASLLCPIRAHEKSSRHSPAPPRRIRYNDRVTEHLHRDWILYAVAAAAAVAIASGLLFYNWWYS